MTGRLHARRRRPAEGFAANCLPINYDQSRGLSWGATGQVIQQLYGFNPWNITRGSYMRFIAEVKAHRPGIPERCLQAIWSEAKSSCRAPLPPDQRQIVSDRLNHLWLVWSDHTQRKQQLERQMIALVDGVDSGRWISPLFSCFSGRMRAKVLAETGPLRRFPHWRALLAYAGLKIRMRSSGTSGGEKIKSLRRGEFCCASTWDRLRFRCFVKIGCLAPYYHRKIKEGMSGGKTKVACMRKLVKILYGAAKSQEKFTIERVYRCAG